jgi:hypothetical protein
VDDSGGTKNISLLLHCPQPVRAGHPRQHIRIGGSYRYQRLAPHIAEIGMIEAHPAGPARYTLLLAYLTVSQGRFYTQHDGPIAPHQRQNSGRGTLQP